MMRATEPAYGEGLSVVVVMLLDRERPTDFTGLWAQLAAVLVHVRVGAAIRAASGSVGEIAVPDARDT